MRIEVSRATFADIIVGFLYEKLVKGEKLIPENKRFTELMELVDQKGLRAYFMKYYLTLDGNTKIHFKRFIKPIKKGSGKSVLEIQKPEELESDKKNKKKRDGITKKIFRKIIGNEAITRKELGFLAEEILLKDEEDEDV